MSCYCLVTGVLSAAPEPVPASASKRRPFYRGALVIEMDSQTWRPASFTTWSTTVAAELGHLDKGDAVSIAGRLSLGAYLKDGEPRIAVRIQIDRLVALPHPARARVSLPRDDPRLELEVPAARA